MEVEKLRIYQIQSREDKDLVKELFWEYLQWANGEVNNQFGVNFDIKAMLEEDMNHLDKFFPPRMVACYWLRKLESQLDEDV